MAKASSKKGSATSSLAVPSSQNLQDKGIKMSSSRISKASSGKQGLSTTFEEKSVASANQVKLNKFQSGQTQRICKLALPKKVWAVPVTWDHLSSSGVCKSALTHKISAREQEMCLPKEIGPSIYDREFGPIGHVNPRALKVTTTEKDKQRSKPRRYVVPSPWLDFGALERYVKKSALHYKANKWVKNMAQPRAYVSPSPWIDFSPLYEYCKPSALKHIYSEWEQGMATPRKYVTPSPWIDFSPLYEYCQPSALKYNTSTWTKKMAKPRPYYTPSPWLDLSKIGGKPSPYPPLIWLPPPPKTAPE